MLAVCELSSEVCSFVDPQRRAIIGGSSGDYTVLRTLCSYSDAFAVGVSSFGIPDIFELAEFTHPVREPMSVPTQRALTVLPRAQDQNATLIWWVLFQQRTIRGLAKH